ncbi:hypothetical protein VKT23_007782 [Stygiomarasmius scandens]|uniref:Uncharacterized protein n=1 Tax=Marasmiellus scandens TaxID=2682957 RepID=A0ABR1JL40_9AGAR
MSNNRLERLNLNLTPIQIAKLAGKALLAVGSSLILPSLGTVIINAIGFTAMGVVAGSLAAGIQSLIYGGATGGLFAMQPFFGIKCNSQSQCLCVE